MSVWEDAGYSLMPETMRRISYEGKYRVLGATMFIQVTSVQHEGPVRTDAFDMSWNEGHSTAEEPRLFQFVTGLNERDMLNIETLPMRNPNGSGNNIVGRTILERIPD